MLTEVRGQTLTPHDCRFEVNLSCCSVYSIFLGYNLDRFRANTNWLNSIHQTNSLFFAFYQQFPAASSLKENASKTLAWDPSASLCLCQVIKSFNFTVFLVRICFLISEKSISFFVAKKYQSVLIVT